MASPIGYATGSAFTLETFRTFLVGSGLENDHSRYGSCIQFSLLAFEILYKLFFRQKYPDWADAKLEVDSTKSGPMIFKITRKNSNQASDEYNTAGDAVDDTQIEGFMMTETSTALNVQ